MFIIINENAEFVIIRECYTTILLTAINSSRQLLPEEELLASGDNRQPTLTPMTFARYWATDGFFGNYKFHSCILLLLKMGKRIAHPGVIRMRYVKRCRSLFHWLAGIGFLGTVMEVLLCQPFFLFRGFWNIEERARAGFLICQILYLILLHPGSFHRTSP